MADALEAALAHAHVRGVGSWTEGLARVRQTLSAAAMVEGARAAYDAWSRVR